MHNDRQDNIFADDDALNLIIYGEIETQDRQRKDSKGDCLGLGYLFICKQITEGSEFKFVYESSLRLLSYRAAV
jgi:hypothetical protein